MDFIDHEISVYKRWIITGCTSKSRALKINDLEGFFCRDLMSFEKIKMLNLKCRIDTIELTC
jgi:hypothetical protein